MAIPAKDVMALRRKSGLGAMECKAALAEADGDMALAEENLRKKGLAKMDGRADRESAEGRVAIAVSDDGAKGAIVEINTETDFTAMNDQFGQMVQSVAEQAVRQDVGSDSVEKTDAIQAAIDELRLTTKENVQFGRGAVLGGPGRKIGSYVHFTGKVAVLIEAEGPVTDDLLKDLCMHVSAIHPPAQGVTEDDICAEVIEKEKQIAKAQAMESGKPEEIAEKMVVGKLNKFLDEVVLLRQPFIKDDKMKVRDLLPKGAAIKRFVRYQVGA